MPEDPDSPRPHIPVVGMTGAGVASGETELGKTIVEVRSVNGRTLTCKHRLAAGAAGMEAAIERAVQARVRRGTVTCIVEVNEDGGRRAALDRAALAAWVEELRGAAAALRLEPDLRIGELLALPGVVTGAAEISRTSRPASRGLAALVGRAVDALAAEREREGAATAAAAHELLDRIEAARALVLARAPGVLADYRARLRLRIDEYLAEHAQNASPSEVLREVAIYADRIDANEELQRIGAHVARARAVLAEGGEVGRALEFLMQELLREVNTLGSKTQDVEIIHTVVAMKGCVDKLRELVANLE